MTGGVRPAAWPTSTYRVQLHARFTFDDAAALAPYLASLGVSHLYCSPVLQATPGSTHGYDVVDHNQLSEDLGGAPAFARMATALEEHGLGIVVDTVPNHMALAGSHNRWWWDVLEDGPASRFAKYFDIDWGTDRAAGPSVLAPILGDHVGRLLDAGELGLQRRGGAFVATYADHELPLSPRSVDALLSSAAQRAGSPELDEIAVGFGALPHASDDGREAIEARHRGKVELRQRLAALTQLEPAVADAIDDELAAIAGDPDAFETLLARQNYRLAHWRTAAEELDYRRFFSITTLVGLRVEDEDVFRDSHRLLAELVDTGRVTGLRIDHIDGLRDPAEYLRRLRALAPDAYIVVEKILQEGERLPQSWPVQGTSGYDHLIAVDRLFVDDAGEEAMTAAYDAFVGHPGTFDEIAHSAKHHVMGEELAAETERLTGLLAEVCASRRRHRDHTRRELRDVLREVLAAFAVYRTYVVEGASPSDDDRAHVKAAVDAAAALRPDLDRELLDLVQRTLLLEGEGALQEVELAARFQQLSAPVMAKGVEDTAFYRYNRLVSLNEVGGEPSAFGRPVDDYHEHCAHLAAHWPDTMLTLSTHDTKRSADVRARIHLLSELPEAWGAATARWADHNERHRRHAAPDRTIEMLVYQTLVGTWPIEPDRLVAAMAKSAKEAKQHTSWTNPDPRFDEALAAFVEGIVGDHRFVEQLEAFLEEHRIVELGQLTALSQVTLLATAPGMPDVYQGTELWDHSLVDPDNRRPVDHERRAALLQQLLQATPKEALHHLDAGGTKLWLLSRLLRDRRRVPARYGGRDHAAIAATGAKARHVVASTRGALTVVVPRLLTGLGDDWGDTSVTLADGAWEDVLTGELRSGGPHPVGELLVDFPVAVLARDLPPTQ